MISAILPLLIILVVASSVSRAISGRARGGGAMNIRHAFQYAVTFALLCLTATGLVGLLQRLSTASRTLVNDDAALARNLTFVVVAGPLFVVMVLWARRGIKTGSDDARSSMFGLFLTLTSATTLITTITAASDMARSVLPATAPVTSLADSWPRLLVWGGLCIAAWRVSTNVAAPDTQRAIALLSSLIGAVYLITGLTGAVAQAVRSAFGPVSLVDSGFDLWTALVILAIGAFVWSFFWLRTALRQTRDGLWLAYVLLVGVGVNFVMAISAASYVIYSTLVWFVGEHSKVTASAYFADRSTAIGLVVSGGIVWLYHRSVIAGANTRTEVNRMYDYIISGISGIAAAVGLSIVVVAGIEAVTSTKILVGTSAMNTLLAAATLIVVGGSVWLWFWQRIQRVAGGDHGEFTSVSRRIYLYLLFGVGGVSAIVSLLIAVYMLFEALISGDLGSHTLRDMRYAVGVLVSTAIIAGYHWTVFRHERGVEVRRFAQTKTVVLVGQRDRDAIREIAQRTGAKVSSWKRTDNADIAWDVEAVVDLIEGVDGHELLIVADPSGAYAIPIDRD